MATTYRTLVNGPQHVVRYMSFAGDVSDEVCFDVSALDSVDAPNVISHLVVEEIWYSVGANVLTFEFDASTDEPIWGVGGADTTGGGMWGYIDFRSFGGIPDPKASGYTGDILVTQATFDAGEPCYVIMKCRKVFA